MRDLWPTIGWMGAGSAAFTQQALADEEDERGPADELKLQFEAAIRLDSDEQHGIRSAIESIIMRNTMKEAGRRFSTAAVGAGLIP